MQTFERNQASPLKNKKKTHQIIPNTCRCSELYDQKSILKFNLLPYEQNKPQIVLPPLRPLPVFSMCRGRHLYFPVPLFSDFQVPVYLLSIFVFGILIMNDKRSTEPGCLVPVLI